MDPGTQLGPYEILERLGAGGMGEVYRAHDRELGRDVAIKVLPEDVADDEHRLSRLRREARSLAALSYPGIATVHGFEEHDGTRFIVMELVEGETLAERLKESPLAVEKALEVAIQIAKALEAAHDRGIVHRDLKPSNVKITPAGEVKLLDFGLAKTLRAELEGASESELPTATVEATRSGTIIGTAAYMSPEQARGDAVDKRTDIWAFGCVLYEMLTGRKAFDRQTPAETLAAVLERRADWSALPAATPPLVRALLRRCLRRDPDRRLHGIANARIEIEEALIAPAGQTGAGEARVRTVPRGTMAIAAAAVITGLVAGWLLGIGTGTEPADPGTLALDEVIRLTYDPRLSEWPTWSPAGSHLAFASNRDGDFDIYVRRVEGGQAVNVTEDPAADFQPAFSPDGEWIAFVSTRASDSPMVKIGSTIGFEFRTYGGDLWVTPALGGRPRRLAEDANFPVWHPSGERIAYVTGRENHRTIVEVEASSASRHPVLEEDSSAWEIVRVQYSPDGAWISFDTVNPDRVMLMPAGGGSARELLSGLSHVWDPAGDRLYFLVRDPSGGTRLQSLAIDPATGAVRGSPRTLGLMTGILRDLAISPNGSRFAASEMEGSLNLTRLPIDPESGTPAGPEEELSSGLVIDRYPVYSPEGDRIVVASDRLGQVEIWLLDPATRELERLELPGEDEGANLAYWAPDGEQLVVSRNHADGTRSLWLTAVDGSYAEELIPPKPRLRGSPFSPDGREVLYSRNVDGTLQLFTLDMESRESRQLTDTPGDKFSGIWSPDRRWIVFNSNASGHVQLWRIPAPGGDEERLTRGTDRIRHAFFSPDGRWLYFQPNHQNIYRMPADGGEPQAVTTFPESGLFLEEPSLSPDGRSLVYSRSKGGSTLWLLTLVSETGLR